MAAGSGYRPTIGLEIHAELATATKMFCACKNDPDEKRPNVNVCPICLAHPGTLPAANRAAVGHLMRIGAALGGARADFSEFDRKSYFYPDIPKGYQISQFEHPFVAGGELAGVAITRVHLEEDTARSAHGSTTLATGEPASLVDFNRAGVPLMELVTEPVIHDAQTAGRFARELQQLLRALGASHANLEKGQMRVEANISVSKEAGKYGTKVEVKNLNSFRSVERAIAYEIERQGALLERGERVLQETRGWDEGRQQTFSQRLKEGSADYRYFPEPDLPKVLRAEVPAWSDAALAADLPELPVARRARYEARGARGEAARVIAEEGALREIFDSFLAQAREDAELAALAANYLTTDIAALLEEGPPALAHFSGGRLLALLQMVRAGELSSRGAKEVIAVLAREGGEPAAIARQRGLVQVQDQEALAELAAKVIGANPGPAADYRAGKEPALQYLVGQAMKLSKGAGNPQKFQELLKKQLCG
ncbi:MAG TPA: Asp-tRNA(Asn)/Glu-tRNA(Gln) amidotransferase subunit GatB [Candidatus Paceibacterota bacterium]|nr:Asp-tRNA(Asn)/Glu-tRNA(Gln) amidotransferase subunit GatB [Candidatus Paceibacterota bacterium]